jgi:hypothetical protein
MYTASGFDMAKLYWRIKKNGKWTWAPLTQAQQEIMNQFEIDFPLEEE